MNRIAVWYPMPPSPFVFTNIVGGASFAYRGSFQFEVPAGVVDSAAAYAKINLMATMLAEEIPANYLPI